MPKRRAGAGGGEAPSQPAQAMKNPPKRCPAESIKKTKANQEAEEGVCVQVAVLVDACGHAHEEGEPALRRRTDRLGRVHRVLQHQHAAPASPCSGGGRGMVQKQDTVSRGPAKHQRAPASTREHPRAPARQHPCGACKRVPGLRQERPEGCGWRGGIKARCGGGPSSSRATAYPPLV